MSPGRRCDWPGHSLSLRAERTARLKGKGVSDVDVEALTDILSSRSAPQTDEGV